MPESRLITRPAITRFAPSPTGYLHLGHALAALTAHDLARQTGGRFLLRIDDIDAGRSRPEFEAAVYEDLTWLGLAWDGPARRQSDCLAEYGAALHRLRMMGLVYPCFCTRKEVLAEAAGLQNAPHDGNAPRYPGTCRKLDADEIHARMQAGANAALRLDSATAIRDAAHGGATLKFFEHGAGPLGEHGNLSACPDLLGDIILARTGANGLAGYSYHLAVVVDDAAQEISCVTRGRDLFFATHAQRLLQALLNLPAPEYMHHALAVDEACKRLAKRHDALSLRHFREQGMTPAQVRAMARAAAG